MPFILATGPLPDTLKHKDNHSSKNCKTYSWVHYVLYNIYTISEGEGRQVQPSVYYNSSTTMKEWRNHELMNESYQNNSLVNNQNCNLQIHRRARSAIPQILHSCSMIGNVIQAAVVMFVVMFIQQTCCSDSYQSHMVIIHTHYFAITYNEIPVTCIRGQIICFPKHPSMPFFYTHAGTRTLGFDPLSVLYSPLHKEVKAACERPTQKR